MIDIVFPDFWPERLAWIVALLTLLTGIAVVAVPRTMMGLFGLAAAGGTNNGVSEVRAIIGGFFIGTGLACLLMAQPFTYFALGMAFLFAFVGRLISFVADRTLNLHCCAALVIEGLAAYFPLQFVFTAYS